ncbi:NADP-dependent oxidoreductase [Caenimonas soli]|uniref:NADP-dependent oxidoreductase n=1 Tax=Caenimonas soli TaxID=2735555 RepID=UPI001552253D|nr:NADP-dependent oxidoreductase [Caenimonas soli]NPC59365.1 NADP-dependent oxidoreductase [Caenimonas soli]
METINRYWTYSDKPVGAWPEPDNFELCEGTIPAPANGQALTRTIYVSLDPYQWAYKELREQSRGTPCHARTVAQVIESRMPGYAPGDLVSNTNGWAEYELMGEGVTRPAYMIPRKLDPAAEKISHAVGVLGMLGLTAYAGMVLQCNPKPGDTVVVSAASGGVGQIAGQLARLRGARVVGIAGRPEKCRFVMETLGFDACVSHLSPSFAEDLKAACPRGVDAYFENVGGEVFEAVLPLLKSDARMTVCGRISHYGEAPGGVAGAEQNRRAMARGVTVTDLWASHYVESHHDAMLAELGPAVASGAVVYREDIRQGLETLPFAFAEMLKGGNFGKMLVQLSEDPTLRGA